MNRDKQTEIKQLAKDIFAPKVALDGIDLAFASAHGADVEDCHFMRIANHLYGKGYRKSTDVAFEAIDNFRDSIMDVFIDMCRGNDYNKLTLLQIGDAIESIYDKQIAELKNKYESEEK